MPRGRRAVLMVPHQESTSNQRGGRAVARHRHAILCLCLALGPFVRPAAADFNAPMSAATFSAPPPRMLELLRREHDPRHHLLVTTTAARYHASVGTIGDEGLRDVAPLESSAELVPASIPWASISSIDRIMPRHRRGRTFGVVLGGIAGGFAGAALGRLASTVETGSDHTYDDVGAFLGTAAGASTGGWLGIRSKVRHPLYIAGSSEDSNDHPGDGSQTLVVDVGESAAWLSPRQIVRVRGSFGEVTGRVGNVAPDGRVRLDRVPELDSNLPLPRSPMEWDEISRIERRGNNWRRGAASGSIVTGLLFGSGAAFIEGVRIDYRPGGRRDSGEAFASGALIGTCTGAAIGAALGALTPRWHRLLDRPLAVTAHLESPQP